MDPLRQCLAIAVVFLLLWLFLAWLKRRGFAISQVRLNQDPRPAELELLEKLALTPQHSIQLVRFRQRLLLVGLHNTGLALLTESAVCEPATRESAPR